MTDNLPWDLEEAVADAIVAYCQTAVSADVTGVNPTRRKQFPSVTVAVGDSDNHTDEGAFTGRRRMDVTVKLTTEALGNNVEVQDGVALTAEEFHRRLKSALLGHLFGNTLHTDLNAISPAGVLFSLAFPTRQERGTDARGRLYTAQTLDVIAQPKAVG